jgi:hypothetical protein
MAGDALVIGLAKKVKPKKASDDEGDEAEDGGMSLDEVEDDAVDEMIEALKGDEPDRESFKSALKDFVVACVKRQGKGDY